MQGDLMYTNDKKMQKIDGKSFITFQPNTILYAVLAESDLGKQIAKSKMGIVFHTTYTGGTIQDLGATQNEGINEMMLFDPNEKMCKFFKTTYCTKTI